MRLQRRPFVTTESIVMLHFARVNNPNTPRARALLFDMDGTLIDSPANVERAYRWWPQRGGLPIDPILAVMRGRTHREVMAQFANGLELDHESAIFTISTRPAKPGCRLSRARPRRFG